MRYITLSTSTYIDFAFFSESEVVLVEIDNKTPVYFTSVEARIIKTTESGVPVDFRLKNTKNAESRCAKVDYEILIHKQLPGVRIRYIPPHGKHEVTEEVSLSKDQLGLVFKDRRLMLDYYNQFVSMGVPDALINLK